MHGHVGQLWFKASFAQHALPGLAWTLVNIVDECARFSASNDQIFVKRMSGFRRRKLDLNSEINCLNSDLGLISMTKINFGFLEWIYDTDISFKWKHYRAFISGNGLILRKFDESKVVFATQRG